MRVFTFAIGLLVLTSSGATESKSSTEDPESWSVDRLIEELPSEGCAGHVDREADAYVWHPAVAEFQRRQAAGLRLTDEQWIALLVGKRFLQWRRHWPAGESFAVSMRVPFGLGQVWILCTPRHPSLRSASAGSLVSDFCGNAMDEEYQRALFQPLGRLTAGTYKILCDVEVRRGESRLSPEFTAPTGPLWNGTIPMDFEVVPTLEEALPGVANELVDAGIGEAVSLAFAEGWFVGNGHQRRMGILVVDPDTHAHARLASLSLALHVELLHGDVVVARHDLLVDDHDPVMVQALSRNQGPRKVFAFLPLYDMPPAAEHDLAAWSVRLTGTDRYILRTWGTDAHWNGTLEVPLDEARERELERLGDEARGPWAWHPRYH